MFVASNWNIYWKQRLVNQNKQLKKLNAVTALEVQRVSRKYFQIEQNSVIIVGKAETFCQRLKLQALALKCLTTMPILSIQISFQAWML